MESLPTLLRASHEQATGVLCDQRSIDAPLIGMMEPGHIAIDRGWGDWPLEQGCACLVDEYGGDRRGRLFAECTGPPS